MTIDHRGEITLKGIAAAPGIAIGPAFLFRKLVPEVVERRIEADELDVELEKLDQALTRSKRELSKILEFAEQKLGPDQAKIFEAQLMILEDSILFESIRKKLRNDLRNADFILQEEIGKYQRLMLAAKDEVTRERAGDLEDVKSRIIRNLQEEKLVSRVDGSYVIISHVLAAADALILSRNDVLAYATEGGGPTSHMALLSRALKIPAVVGLHQFCAMVHGDDRVIVDGYSGAVIINPEDATIAEYEHKRAEYHEFETRLAALRDLTAETLDGHRINLSANIELEQELDFLKLQGADGIGLYRSETLLLGREDFPTEEEQFQHYKRIVESVAPKKVIIRTFDIGGDKLMSQAIKENNPFLGWRGIRIMLDKPEIFLDQLRAILRVSTKKNVSVMFPMISNIKEVRLAKQLLEQAKDQLHAQHLPFDSNIEIGVMVEVPAAAVIADDLAKEVDFLSIGTNDLIQYLLAVDRGNDIVSDLYQEFHPAVVRFLRRIIERGKQEGVWVGMCGEMAGDPLATMLLVGLGLDEFSVTPTMLPEIKKIIRSIHFTEAKHIANKVLNLDTEDQIKKYLTTVMRQKFPDIPLGD